MDEQDDLLKEISLINSVSLKNKLKALYQIKNQEEDLIRVFKNEIKLLKAKYLDNCNSILNDSRKIIKGEADLYEYVTETFVEKFPFILNNNQIKTHINEYWPKVIFNCEYFKINEIDKDILKKLKDVEIRSEGKVIILLLEFELNDYFSNQEKLWKKYIYDDNNCLSRIEPIKIMWRNEEKSPLKTDSIQINEKRSFFEMFETITNMSSEERFKQEEELMVLRDEIIPNSIFYYSEVTEEDPLDEYLK